MGVFDWFKKQTPLQLAIDRGLQPNGNLIDELRGLGEFQVRSEADAEAICDALVRLPPPDPKQYPVSPLGDIVGLFQRIEGQDCPAFPILAEKGIDRLIPYVARAIADPESADRDGVLFALKIAAMFGSRAGSEAVVRAARAPLWPDAYMWSVVLSPYGQGHPESEWVFAELSETLPPDFLAISLLDAANAAHRAEAIEIHPFDSDSGVQMLRQWLTDGDEELFSYAISATAALPFISHSERDALLALAFDHPSGDVQVEAAWAAAKLGREAGLRWLARTCLDANQSARARQYLEELGRSDLIPTEADDEEFRAKAEFSQWLAHPSELGRPPNELEIVDHRELAWPPDGERKSLWLIRYVAKDPDGLDDDDVGVGLVGSITFCLFSYDLTQRPPEDCYALHCYWEMSNEFITDEAVDAGSREYDSLLARNPVDGVVEAKIVHIAELSPKLRYPQSLVAIAEGMREGDSGWVVLDGPRSRWYPAHDMPKGTWGSTVLMVHIGRELLGFKDALNRQEYLLDHASQRTPEEVVTAFERLLGAATDEAVGGSSPTNVISRLASKLKRYAAARAALRDEDADDIFRTTFMAILQASHRATPADRKMLLGSNGAVENQLIPFVEILVRQQRQSEVPALIEAFRPYCEYPLGYSQLGKVAQMAGLIDLAANYFEKERDSYKDWCRSENMSVLAEIWKSQGRVADAQKLLLDALTALVEQSRKATGSDRALFEKWFQDRREAFLKLFPGSALSEMRQRGIPESTLR